MIVAMVNPKNAVARATMINRVIWVCRLNIFFPHPKRGFFLTGPLPVMEMRVASGVPTGKTTFSGDFSAGWKPWKNRAAKRKEDTLLEQLGQLILEQRVEVTFEHLVHQLRLAGGAGVQ